MFTRRLKHHRRRKRAAENSLAPFFKFSVKKSEEVVLNSFIHRFVLFIFYFGTYCSCVRARFKMYIKSIILEGFKSYAERTEINGFDPLFNAITGLNGSGKSNILDSICFLLGITNLSQVNKPLCHRRTC